MRPPICEICGTKMGPRDEGGLVYFKKGEKGQKWDERAQKEEGFVGHPPYAGWFCEEHYEAASKLDNLRLSEALNELSGAESAG